MKRTTLLGLGLCLAASALGAEEGQKWVGLIGGYDRQMYASRRVQDNSIWGATYGTWLTNRWGYDVSVLGTQLIGKHFKADAMEYHGQLSALFNLAPSARSWVPYLRAGAGATQVEAPWSYKEGTTTRLSFNGGIGVQGNLAEHLLLGFEARGQRIYTQVHANEILGLVTLGYRWGGKAAPMAAPAPAPVPPPPPVEEKPVPPPPPPPPPVEEKPVPPPPPPPPPAPAPMKITLDNAVLHFANGSNVLPAKGVAAIQEVAAKLKTFKGEYTLHVTGHTSSVGKAAFNKALSKRRADAVAKVLVASGIPAASVTTAGVGPDEPIGDNKTAEGQARNRRVEIDVKVKGAQVETRTLTTDLEEGKAKN